MRIRKVGALLSAAAVLFILIIGISSASLHETVENGSTPKHIALTWTGDSETTQTITWQTDSSVAGQVQFREQDGTIIHPAGGKVVAADTKPVSTNQGIRYVHNVTLTGLRSGVRYVYRVSGGSTWSEPMTFHTGSGANKDFAFLVFGDSQSIDYNTWHSTLHQAYRVHPDAAFITNVGDLVDVGQDYAQWNAWFTAGQGILNSVPIMPIAGNHESYTPERKFSMPALFTAQFSLPLNGPDGMQEQAYSFDYGDVHFVMLDSQEGEQKQFIPDLLAKQKKWLEKDLAQSTKRWTIAFIHRPLYGNMPLRDNAAIREAFGPVFDKYKIDLVFTGHDHVYARTYPLQSGEVSSAGTVYVAAGRSGSKSYWMASANSFDEFFYNPQAEPMYLAVKVMSDTISVQAFTQSGTPIDAWSVTKRNL